jgi:hypothetical protein
MEKGIASGYAQVLIEEVARAEISAEEAILALSLRHPQEKIVAISAACKEPQFA